MGALAVLSVWQTYFLGLDRVAQQWGVSLALVVVLLSVHVVLTLVWNVVLVQRASFTGLMWVYHLMSLGIIGVTLLYLVVAVLAHQFGASGVFDPLVTLLNL
jgi:hypothetical protein